jgi:hypothetical protein
MSNYPKFFICTNKKAAYGRLFLYHTQNPRFIGEILTFKSFSDYDKYQEKPAKNHICKIEGVNYTICTAIEIKEKIIGLFVIEFMDTPEGFSEDPKLNGLMNRVTDWLKGYFSD